MEPEKHIAFKIPERLHMAAKLRAVKEGKNLRKVFLEALEEAMKKGGSRKT
jgi:predicted HicB family RNase H-like nuclease